MKIYIILLFICLTPFSACSQDHYQTLVLKEVLNDQSVSTFFQDKDTVKLVKNEYCEFKVGTKLRVENKLLNVVANEDNQSKALKIIGYEETENYIVIEIALFRDTVIYTATYRREGNKINPMMTNVIFIKSPQN